MHEHITAALTSLSALIGAPVERLPPVHLPGFDPDAVVRVARRDAPDLVFVLESKPTTAPSAIAAAAARVTQSCPPTMLPLVVTPWMSDEGQRLCEAAGAHWLDLSGNAHIRGPGLLIRIEGRPNLFKRPGRPEDPFATRSARVARALLHAPGAWHTQTCLVEQTRLSKSVVSRAVARVDELGLLQRQKGDARAFRPRSAVAFLDAWGAHYAFKRHRVTHFHHYARTGAELVRELSGLLTAADTKHAMTGLAAAWLHQPHASFRLATAFVAAMPSPPELEKMGLRPVETAANIWLVVPDDDDILRDDYLVTRDGVRCVDVPQTWLDLQHQPERASEAAEILMQNWGATA